MTTFFCAFSKITCLKSPSAINFINPLIIDSNLEGFTKKAPSPDAS